MCVRRDRSRLRVRKARAKAGRGVVAFLHSVDPAAPATALKFLLAHFADALHQGPSVTIATELKMTRGLAPGPEPGPELSLEPGPELGPAPGLQTAPGAASGPLVRFENVSRRFGGVAAVDGLSLDIYPGEFFALLGPSGCGKTTLLRMLAGFERPDAGRILLDGRDVGATPAHRRPVNMMFQSYALFPHLTVAGNIAFGLHQEGMGRADIAARVDGMLALVRLEGLGGRRPDQLSGGQRQRVALARSLAKQPRVLLLDEPMAALDRKLREETQFELMALRARLGMTFVIVTHDQAEAMTVAHRIAVMDRGRIVQAAPPAEIYEQPRSRWVAQFVGDVNLIDGRVVDAGAGEALIEDKAGRRYRVAADVAAGAEVAIAVRPEKMRMEAGSAGAPECAPGPDAPNAMAGRVEDIGYLGGISIYKVRLDDGAIVKAAVANVARTGGPAFRTGDPVWLSWPPDAGVVLTG
jgi:putrescine transport system ATP-binding protein